MAEEKSDPPKEKDLEEQLSELEEELIEKLHEIDEGSSKSDESILSDEFGKILYLPQLLRPVEEHSSKLILDEHKYYKYKPETIPKIDPAAPKPLLKKLSSGEITAKTHEFLRSRRISNLSNMSVPSIEKQYQDDVEFQPFLHNDYSKLEDLEKKLENVLKFTIISDLIKEIEETIEEKEKSVEEAEEKESQDEEEAETVAEEPKIIDEEPKIDYIPKIEEEIPREVPIKLSSLTLDVPKPKPKVPRKSHIPARKTSELLVIGGYVIKEAIRKGSKSSKEHSIETLKSSGHDELANKGQFIFKRPSSYKEPSSEDILEDIRDSLLKDEAKGAGTEVLKSKSILHTGQRSYSIKSVSFNKSGFETIEISDSSEVLMEPARSDETFDFLNSTSSSEGEKEEEEEQEEEREQEEQGEEGKQKDQEEEEIVLTKKEKALCLCPKKEIKLKSCICPHKYSVKKEPKKMVCFCSPEKLNTFTSTTELCKMVQLKKNSNPIREDCLCGFSVKNCTPINTQDLQDSCLCSKPLTEKLLSKFGIKRYPRKEIVDPPPLVRHLEEALGIVCPRVQIKHYPPLNSCSDLPICEKILGTIQKMSSSNSSIRNCRCDQLRIHLEPPFGCQCNIEAFSFSSSNNRTRWGCKLRNNTSQTSENMKGAYFLTEEDISVCMNDETRSYLGSNIKVTKAVVRFLNGRPKLALQISLQDKLNETTWYSIDANEDVDNSVVEDSGRLVNLHKVPHHSIVDPVFMKNFNKNLEEDDDNKANSLEAISLKPSTAVPDLNFKLNSESPIATSNELSENLIGNFPTTCKPTEKFTLAICTDRATTTSACPKTKICIKKFLKPSTYQQKLRPRRVKNESCICGSLSRKDLSNFGDLKNLKPPCKNSKSILCSTSKYPSSLPSSPVLGKKDFHCLGSRRMNDIVCLQKSDTSIVAPKCIQKLSKCVKMNSSDNKPPENFKNISQVDSLDNARRKFKENHAEDHVDSDNDDIVKKAESDDSEYFIPKIEPVKPKRNSLLRNSLNRFSSVVSILKHPSDYRNNTTSSLSIKSVHFDTSYPIRNTAKKLSSGNITFPKLDDDLAASPTNIKKHQISHDSDQVEEKTEDSKTKIKLKIDPSSGHIFVHKTSDDSINSNRDVAVGDLDSLLALGKTLANTIKNTTVEGDEKFVVCENCGGYKEAGVSICTQDEANTSNYCKKFEDDEDTNEVVGVDKDHLKELDQQLHQLLNSSIKCRCGCDFDIPYRNFVAARGLLNNEKKSRLSRCFNAIKSIFK